MPGPLGTDRGATVPNHKQNHVEYSMRKGFEDPFCKAYSTQGAAAGQRPDLGA